MDDSPDTSNSTQAGATQWEIDVPLLSNRIMVGGVVRGFGIAALMMGSVLTRASRPCPL